MPMIAAKQGTERIGRRLKLRDLRILMTVVECGTMGKAAGRLSISQPVVSKAIADMEHALGVRLLDRSQRDVEPTPYGRALIKRGIAIFDEMRQGIEEIEFLSDPTAGEVRIGATDPINAAIVAPVIDRLSRQYPRMTFHVVAGVPGPLRQEEREADDNREETVRREQLVAQNDGGSCHGKPRRIKTDRAKHPRLHRAEISVGRIQHPRLAQQLGKLDLAAAASQWIVRPSGHDQGIAEKDFFRILLARGTRKSGNREIHIAGRHLLPQRPRHAGDDMKSHPRILP